MILKLNANKLTTYTFPPTLSGYRTTPPHGRHSPILRSLTPSAGGAQSSTLAGKAQQRHPYAAPTRGRKCRLPAKVAANLLDVIPENGDYTRHGSRSPILVPDCLVDAAVRRIGCHFAANSMWQPAMWVNPGRLYLLRLLRRAGRGLRLQE